MPGVTRYDLWSLGLVVVALVIGRVANRRMHPQEFVRYVHLGLIGIGVLLLAPSVAVRQ